MSSNAFLRLWIRARVAATTPRPLAPFTPSLTSPLTRVQPLRRPVQWFTTNSGGGGPTPASTPPPSSLIQRTMHSFRNLTHKYGKVATIVYFGISTVDLGLSIWFVHAAGQERVMAIEKWMQEKLGDWAIVGRQPSQVVEEESASMQATGPSWTSTALIGYSIHKLLMPVRIPLTIMITPSVAARFHRLGYFLPKK